MSDSATASKAYDDMTKEERAAHDTKERQREREEQASESTLLRREHTEAKSNR